MATARLRVLPAPSMSAEDRRPTSKRFDSGVFVHRDWTVAESAPEPNTPSTWRDQLQAKYDRIVERYDELIRKYSLVVARVSRQTTENSDLRCLAFSMLRNADLGCAMVRGGRVCLTNVSFDRLDQADLGLESWESADPHADAQKDTPRVYTSLRALAAAEANRIQRPGQRVRIRFKSAFRTVDVTVEGLLNDVQLGATAAVLVEDVTELVRAQSDAATLRDRFQQHARARSQAEASAGLVHDLHNLLGAITFQLAVLRGDPICSKGHGALLAAMDLALGNSTDLVSRLRSIARPSTNSVPVNLVEVASSAFELACASRAVKGSRYRLWLDPSLSALPCVKGSADELRNVFLNLTINAIDAMPNGGTISLTGRLEDRVARIRIEDEGPGIPADVVDRIFEPFFTTKGANGTGLGLALAKQTIEGLGGSIRALRRARCGACIELRLRVWAPTGREEDPIAIRARG